VFAGAAREAVFSNPDVIRRVNADFIPVALKAALVNNPPDDEEGRLYREIGRSKIAPQGICVVNPAGKVLDWVLTFDDDKSVLAFLDHTLQRFARYSGAEQAVAAERYARFPSQKLEDAGDYGAAPSVADRHPGGKHCPAEPPLPEGTAVARLFGRALDQDGKPVADTLRQEHYVEDRFEVTVETQGKLAEALAAAGEGRVRLPDEFTRQLVAHAYLGVLDVQPIANPGRSKGEMKRCMFWARPGGGRRPGGRRERIHPVALGRRLGGLHRRGDGERGTGRHARGQSDMARLPRDDRESHDPAGPCRGRDGAAPLRLGARQGRERGGLPPRGAPYRPDLRSSLRHHRRAGRSGSRRPVEALTPRYPSTPRRGQISASLHSAHRAFRAVHTARPCSIQAWERKIQSSRGKASIRSRSTFTGSCWCVNPIRRAMRPTCVSTTTPSEAPKALPRTQFAVLRATPGRASNSSIERGTFPPCRSTIARAAEVAPAQLRRRKYVNVALLVMDEIGFEPMSRQDANLLFRLVSYRYQRGSIVLTTNKGVRDWPEILAGDEVLATAILDMLLHRSHVLDIKDRSYRLRDLEQAAVRRG